MYKLSNNPIIAKLQKLCKEAGLRLNEFPNGHFQIEGQKLVNYYPLSRRKTVYIAVPFERKHYVEVEAAVKMAGSPRVPKAPAVVVNDRPSERTPEEWARIVPIARFGWKRGESAYARK